MTRSIKPGQLVYIEALTGTSKDNGNWSINGIYEFKDASELKVYLMEGDKPISVYKSRIEKLGLFVPVEIIK